MRDCSRNRFRYIATFGLTLGATLHAHALTLVENGAPRATIVIAQAAVTPAKDDAAAQKVSVAAHDLQDYIRKISGATLPIAGDDTMPAGAVILVGKSRLSDAAKIDIPSGLTVNRKEEGFVIQGKGDRLALAGNDAGPYHGTEYAVYDFLERLGVRWFMPGDFGEYVPAQKTVNIADMMVREKPDFIQRNWWLHTTPEMAALESRWKIRNKMNPDNMFQIPGDSSVRGFVPAAETAKTDPDMFAKNYDGSINLSYPNLSNPKSVEFAAGIAKQYFRDHPTETSLGIAPDDGMPRDFSPGTMKLNQGFSELVGRDGVPAEMSASEEWMAWINAVARAVNKEMPGHIITTSVYANRNAPPFGVPVDPNVGLEFAAIWSDTLHAYDDPKSWQMVRQRQILQRWCALNDKVFIYNYDYTMLASGLTPVPTTRKLARDIPLMKKWGLAGFLAETRNIWAEGGITTKYVRARLEWNANADVKAIQNDYFAKWYGAAAQPSHAFWDALEETIENTPVIGHEDRVLPWVYTPALMTKLEMNLTAAERAAATPRDKLHVQIDRLIYEHLKYYMAMNDADLNGNFAEAARQAALMLAVRPKLYAINSFLMMPTERLPDGGLDYNSGVLGWAIIDRQNYYQALADMQSGKTGTLVAMLPPQAAFTIDPKDEGRYAGWYRADWNTSKWPVVTTAKPFYLQGYMDATGYPYMGNIWYQFKTKVPESARAQRVSLYIPIIETEAWVFVNGQYIGHRPYHESYERPNDMDVDVTNALQPGRTNVITIRVSTSLNRTSVAGGLTSRSFLYTPKAQETVAAKPGP